MIQKYKLLLLAIVLLVLSNSVQSQEANPQLVSLDIAEAFTVGTNTTLTVRIANDDGGGGYTIVANSLELSLDANGYTEFLGIDASNGFNKWSVMSISTGAANTIKLTNNATLNSNEIGDLVLSLKGTSVGSGQNITATIFYRPEKNPLISFCTLSGGCFNSVQGDTSPDDNNVSTQVAVTTLLPLRLLAFDAVTKDCNVSLIWNTADEVNTDHFQIEESENGSTFAVIGKVKSQGNGPGKEYTFPVGERSQKRFYRIRIVDKDASYVYSPLRVSQPSCTSISKLHVAPNPASTGTQHVRLSIYSAETTIAEIVVRAADGKIIMKKNASLKVGSQSEMINVYGLAPGSYSISIYKTGGSLLTAPAKLLIQ